MKRDLSSYRKQYVQNTLNETDVPESPYALFDEWFAAAEYSQVEEPNAFSLATLDPTNRISNRMVLLKQIIDNKGFVFYTNYLSRKGKGLDIHPQAAMLFFWPELERQIRIEGAVEKTDAADSDHYFDSRPEKSRISAIASPQSQRVTSRKILEDQFNKTSQISPLKRPEYWGGYLIKADYFEFWQGRSNRLHDRICYQLNKNTWEISRLAP